MKKKTYERKDWHSSPDPKHRLGAAGEDLTAEYVKKQLGMRVLERNVRFAPGEIDIVAIDGSCICFIEVKTRTNLKYGRPSLAITPKKLHTMKILAEIYMRSRRQYAGLIPRLDVSEILFVDGKPYINYIKSVNK